MKSDLYALLIGASRYLPNTLPDGSSYPDLEGCVHDAEAMESFIRRKLEVPEDRIITLTSSLSAQAEPSEPPERWPTYENMISALRRLVRRTRWGDHLLFYYAGHGGRAPTLIPSLKGVDGVDESLVPIDIGRPTARYLRDVEIAKMLQSMRNRGLRVTLIFDACHFGGATRGDARIGVRGVRSVDTAPRPDSWVASARELAKSWFSLSPNGRESGGGWLPQSRDYVVLSACRPSETAYEAAFEGRPCGAFTYWLLDAMEDIGPSLTYKRLHARVLAKVHSQFPYQTPQLDGESQAIVLGCDRAPRPGMAEVVEAAEDNRRFMIEPGCDVGLKPGARLAIYNGSASEPIQADRRLAVAEVERTDSSAPRARVLRRFAQGSIKPGNRAVLLEQRPLRLCRTVRLVQRHEDASPQRKTAFEHLERTLREQGGSLLEMAQDDDRPDFQVAINSQGEYEIWDPAGLPLPNLEPIICAQEADAAQRVLERLRQLVKYRRLRDLDHHDPSSPLRGALVAELSRMGESGSEGEAPSLQPFSHPGNEAIAGVGEGVCLSLRNESTQPLHLGVLALQPDWSVRPVIPSLQAGQHLAIEPGTVHYIPMRSALPEGFARGREVFKIFASSRPFSFDCLQPEAAVGLNGSAAEADSRPSDEENPLQELLGILASEEAGAEELAPEDFASHEWTVEQLELCTVRSQI